MRSPIAGTLCLAALASAGLAHAERVEVGVSVRRDTSCLRRASRRFALRADPALATGGDQYFHSRELHVVRLGYLQVPVHARFLMVPDRGIRPYLLAGIFVARRRNRDATAGLSSHGSRLADGQNTWRGWNAGVSGGGGVSLFEKTPLQLFGEVVFERGLVDVYARPNTERRTNTMRVAGGFSFRVGSR